MPASEGVDRLLAHPIGPNLVSMGTSDKPVTDTITTKEATK